MAITIYLVNVNYGRSVFSCSYTEESDAVQYAQAEVEATARVHKVTTKRSSDNNIVIRGLDKNDNFVAGAMVKPIEHRDG